MGIVNNRSEALSGVDRLEATGRYLGCSERPRNSRISDTKKASSGDRAERVEDVEIAGERNAKIDPSSREAAARGIGDDRPGL